MIAVQSKSLSLAGMMTNDDILNLTKPDIFTAVSEQKSPQIDGVVGFISLIACLFGWFFATTTRGTKILSGSLREKKQHQEFSMSIKKGSHKATLWNVTSADHSSGVSNFLRRNRRFASLRIDLAMYLPTVSPSSLVASINSMVSFGTREATCVDLLLALPVATTSLLCNRCLAVYRKKQQIKPLKCLALLFKVVSTLIGSRHQETAKPAGATNTDGLLTTTDSNSIEVAMSNRTTHPKGRDSYTLNKFTWRFLAINRHDKKAKPCRLSVEAGTEREARRILAPHFILSLSARIPVLEVAV